MMPFRELRRATESLEGKPIIAYMSLLNRLARYYLQSMPSEFEDEVIFETELLLNQLYAEAVNQDLPIDIQEIILETLSKSSFLSHGIKYRSERNVDFFKTAKVLGRTIRFIAESIERM